MQTKRATAKMRLVQIAEEIVSVLISDANATVKVVVEISAEFPDGAKDSVKRRIGKCAKPGPEERGLGVTILRKRRHAGWRAVLQTEHASSAG